MVPLSVLESVQATLAAQLADLRADAKAALADAKADAKAAMATQRSDAAARLKRELEQSQQLSAASYQALQLYGQHALAAANYSADVATRCVNARMLAENSLAVIWHKWSELTSEVQAKMGVT